MYNYIWAAQQNPTKWVCAQQRLRSVWASAQTDQSLRCVLNGKLRTQAFFMWTAKTLIRLGGCPGWSESSRGAHAILLVLSWGGSYFILLARQDDYRYSIHRAWHYYSSSPDCIQINRDILHLQAKDFSDQKYLSRRMTKPTKWHVRQAKTLISLEYAKTDQSLCRPHEEPLGP